jgi:DNA-binding response OmpR family regulator
MSELLARLRAIVRRRAGVAAPVLTNGMAASKVKCNTFLI